MKQLLATFIGSLTLLALMFLVMGPKVKGGGLFGTDATFLEVIGMWVVCTAGLVLIPFFLLAWCVGRIVLGVIEQFRSCVPASTSAQQEKYGSPMHYVRRARVQGQDDATIQAALQRGGWSKAQIQDAMRQSTTRH